MAEVTPWLGLARLLLSGGMPLLSIVIVLVVAGFLLWAVQTFIPMDAKVKVLLQVVVIVVLLIWVLQGTGVLSSMDNVRIHK
jgi:hypothetical protein